MSLQKSRQSGLCSPQTASKQLHFLFYAMIGQTYDIIIVTFYMIDILAEGELYGVAAGLVIGFFCADIGLNKLIGVIDAVDMCGINEAPPAFLPADQEAYAGHHLVTGIADRPDHVSCVLQIRGLAQDPIFINHSIRRDKHLTSELRMLLLHCQRLLKGKIHHGVFRFDALRKVLLHICGADDGMVPFPFQNLYSPSVPLIL